MTEGWTTVQTFESWAEAKLAKVMLEEAEIESVVSGDDAGGIESLAITQGIDLLVNPADAARARQVLKLDEPASD